MQNKVPQVPEELNKKLVEMAKQVRLKAYSPYSQFQVGAVIIDDKDRWFKGVNVENLSYGITVCAERSAVSMGVLEGMSKIKYVCVIGNTPEPLAPCGACRQTLFEFSNPDTIVIMNNMKGDQIIAYMDQVFPFAFSLQSLKDNLSISNRSHQNSMDTLGEIPSPHIKQQQHSPKESEFKLQAQLKKTASQEQLQ